MDEIGTEMSQFLRFFLPTLITESRSLCPNSASDFYLIVLKTKVPLMLPIKYTKYMPNIPSHSGEKVDFIGFTIFCSHWRPSWIQDHADCYSEAQKSCHNACEI